MRDLARGQSTLPCLGPVSTNILAGPALSTGRNAVSSLCK